MPSYSQYKRQLAVLDADDTDIEAWITVKGNHIPIKKGQSKEEAVKSFIESKNGGGKSAEPKKSNKSTFYKNVSGKQFGTPSGRTIIENELLTEKEMQKYGADPTSEKFEKKDLGKKDHHYFFGARFETPKNKMSKPSNATGGGEPVNGTKEKPYIWHTDAGHGWMEVPLSEIKDLGIDVTEYSYKSGDKAFLEEDKDMGTFIEAYEKKYGQKPEWVEKYDGSNSPIREMERFKKQEKQEHQMSGSSINNIFQQANAGLQSFVDDTGYQPQTTFWSDFGIAEPFGEKAIEDTYNRAFREWKNDKVYLTELSMMLNWKIWQHYDRGNEKVARLYDKLWKQTDKYAHTHLKGDDLQYYIRTTD